MRVFGLPVSEILLIHFAIHAKLRLVREYHALQETLSFFSLAQKPFAHFKVRIILSQTMQDLQFVRMELLCLQNVIHRTLGHSNFRAGTSDRFPWSGMILGNHVNSGIPTYRRAATSRLVGNRSCLCIFLHQFPDCAVLLVSL
jgi:hypothetical protein